MGGRACATMSYGLGIRARAGAEVQVVLSENFSWSFHMTSTNKCSRVQWYYKMVQVLSPW